MFNFRLPLRSKKSAFLNLRFFPRCRLGVRSSRMLHSVVGRLLPTLWENISVPSSRVKVCRTIGTCRLSRNFGNELFRLRCGTFRNREDLKKSLVWGLPPSVRPSLTYCQRLNYLSYLFKIMYSICYIKSVSNGEFHKRCVIV